VKNGGKKRKGMSEEGYKPVIKKINGNKEES
jgi:hypothetical protein